MSGGEIRNLKFEVRSKFEIRRSEIPILKFALSAFLFSVAVLGLTGCATTEEDQMNYSERPWNTPRDWETGLPSTLNQGR